MPGTDIIFPIVISHANNITFSGLATATVACEVRVIVIKSSSMAHPPESRSSLSPFTIALVSGALAGTTVDLSLYPLDTLKTRLQSPSSFLSSGGFSGIYAGMGSAIIGSAPGAALFFSTYEYTKSFLSTQRHANATILGFRHGESDWALPFEHMAAASLGEVAACAVRVPTEVVKQRAQARQYPSSMAALTSILHQRRAIGFTGVWRELYRGWSITIFREVPFTVIQFPLWEALKNYRLASTGRSPLSGAEAGLGSKVDPITPIESAVAGSIAGAIAAGITTPLDVLKTRMMLAREKIGLGTLLQRILAESGPRAFFAGIGPRIGWISAGGAIFLGSYQWAHNRLDSLQNTRTSESRGF